DTANGRTLGHHEDKRFGLCSTFKLLLAAVILREADAGRIDPTAFMAYGRKDLLSHAPVTKANVEKGGMSVIALARAAQTTSDNTAANLLLKMLGGPAAFTAMLRVLGDPVTRLDRYETELNFVPPGEMRDTTTPRAMAQIFAHVLAGNTLTAASRAVLIDWMIATQTGLKRIRAGLPAHWPAGDKTGTAAHPAMPNKHNDVAIIFPLSVSSHSLSSHPHSSQAPSGLPARAPVIVAAYFNAAKHSEQQRPEDDAVLAKVGSVVAKWIVAA
ncbi:MAG: class A beta-lactamase, partial [Betaproteobacteria bacterium]